MLLRMCWRVGSNNMHVELIHCYACFCNNTINGDLVSRTVPLLISVFNRFKMSLCFLHFVPAFLRVRTGTNGYI